MLALIIFLTVLGGIAFIPFFLVNSNHIFLNKKASNRIFLTFDEFQSSFDHDPNHWNCNALEGKFYYRNTYYRIDFVNYYDYRRAIKYIKQWTINKHNKRNREIYNEITKYLVEKEKEITSRQINEKALALDKELQQLLELYKNIENEL